VSLLLSIMFKVRMEWIRGNASPLIQNDRGFET
jgi:hypothetical protein